MRIARIIGTVTATAKDAALTGRALLVADVVDAKGKVLEASVVVADTQGAGVGDMVLVTQGSAARMPGATTGAPVDMAVVGIIDHVSV